MKYTIINRATDDEYTDTLERLVSFVNTREYFGVNDYRIVLPNNYSNNPNPLFRTFLEHCGYDIKWGRAIKSEVK